MPVGPDPGPQMTGENGIAPMKFGGGRVRPWSILSFSFQCVLALRKTLVK